MKALTAAALLAFSAVFAQADEAVKGEQVVLSCEAVYLPARSTWVREVRFTLGERRIRGVEIDGVPVYSFSVFDTVLLTALDNERIQLDTATLTWRSDFRGQATSEGRCTRQ